jgi:hypothetical protein
MFAGANFNIGGNPRNRGIGPIGTVERLVGARRDDYKRHYDREKMHA